LIFQRFRECSLHILEAGCVRRGLAITPGTSTGEYQDFVTGFVIDDSDVRDARSGSQVA
jgi:hypothetical protein